MPFKSKLKKTFSRKSGSGDSAPTADGFHRRSDIEYYKPNQIPKPKYKGKLEPEHEEKLHSFSFADAFARRASSAISGSFSPRGTQSQSRRASCISQTGSSRRESDRPDSGSSKDEGLRPDEVKTTGDARTDSGSEPLSRSMTTQTAANDGPQWDLQKETTITQERRNETKNSLFSVQELNEAMRKASLLPMHASVLPAENAVAA